MKPTQFLDETGNHKLLDEQELIEISACLKMQGEFKLADRVIDHLSRMRFEYNKAVNNRAL